MKKLFFFLSFLPVSFCNAQTISLQECVETGIKNHPDIQNRILTLESSQADVEQAKSLRYPQMSASINQGTNIGRSIDRFTNTYINQLYNSTYAGVSLNMPVFQFFRIKNQINQAESMKESQILNVEIAKNDLTARIVKAYLEVLAGKELLDIAERQVATSTAQMERISKQVDAGTVGKPQLLQIRSQLGNDQLAFIDSKNAYKALRLALFQVLNAKPDDNVVFEAINSNIEDRKALQGVYENALNSLPQLKAANFEINSFDYRVKAIKAQNLPRLGFGADYGTFYASSNPEGTFFEQLNSTRSGSFSLGVNIPIFGRLQTKPAIHTATVGKKLAQNRLETTKLLMRQDVELTVQAFQAAKDRYEVAQQQVAINKENLEAVELQINAGTLNTIEYILAKTNYDRANSTIVQAKYQYLLQKKLLDFFDSGNWSL